MGLSNAPKVSSSSEDLTPKHEMPKATKEFIKEITNEGFAEIIEKQYKQDVNFAKGVDAVAHSTENLEAQKSRILKLLADFYPKEFKQKIERKGYSKVKPQYNFESILTSLHEADKLLNKGNRYTKIDSFENRIDSPEKTSFLEGLMKNIGDGFSSSEQMENLKKKWSQIEKGENYKHNRLIDLLTEKGKFIVGKMISNPDGTISDDVVDLLSLESGVNELTDALIGSTLWKESIKKEFFDPKAEGKVNVKEIIKDVIDEKQKEALDKALDSN